MRYKKIIIIMSAALFTQFAHAGLIASIAAHSAGYALGGVAAHEIERKIDHKDDNKKNDNTQTSTYSSPSSSSVIFPVEQALPDPVRTPGAINLDVTQQNIEKTICVMGYTKTIRPPSEYTSNLKRRQIKEYGYSDHNMRDFEEDHLVSLEIGGAPQDAKNLWPEPNHVQYGWGSKAKDQLENKLHELVCNHEITLAKAQHDEATNWISAYKKYVSPTPQSD
jgi:hypothetical protein